MTDGQASISTEILARYAKDAALEVDGVRGIAGRRGSRVDGDGRIELRLELEWGASIPGVGRVVQARVREYLLRMADLQPADVDVIVDRIGPSE
jgi:uncharacterized alkaline shock family protein YloU